jgi:hypothetical protein
VLAQRALVAASAAIYIGFAAVAEPVAACRRCHARTRFAQAAVAISRGRAASAVSAKRTITAAGFARRHLRGARVRLNRIRIDRIGRDAEAWNGARSK